MRKNWLNNRVVLLTGASSGIGRALTKKLICESNCFVYGVGRNEQKMQSLAVELGDKANRFEYIISDISQMDNWQIIADKITGKNVSVFINNAGVLPPFQSFDKYDADTINNTINTNLISVIHGCAKILPIIEKSDNPAVINVASSAGLCALPGISVYSATKAGVKNFTESLMCEKDYYVGLVCPGFTKTEIFRYQKHDADSKLINMVSTNLDKMCRKIYKGIKKRKKRMVFGIDAKAMDKLYRLMPKSSLKFFSSILSSARVDLFKDVFEK